jgi:hypothetical protein
MHLDKEQIIQFLRDQGKHEQADRAQQDLPDKVDTDQHGGLLAQHGIDLQELLGKLGGGNLGKLL